MEKFIFCAVETHINKYGTVYWVSELLIFSDIFFETLPNIYDGAFSCKKLH